MSKSNIVFTTTFRPFSNSENDEIQLEFIKSLLRQTSNEWLLLTTQFLDENIDKRIIDLLIHKLFYYSQDCDYNHNDVVLNAINFLETNLISNNNFIVWTNPDLIYPEDFVENLINNYYEIDSFILYPNNHKKSLKSEKVHSTNFMNDGIDCIGFSNKTDFNEIKKSLTIFKTDGYGYFEFLLSIIVFLNSSKSKNIKNVFTVPTKIENPRNSFNYDKIKSSSQSLSNEKILIDYLNTVGIPNLFVSPSMVNYLYGNKTKKNYLFAYARKLKTDFIKYIYTNLVKIIPIALKKNIILFLKKLPVKRL